MLAKQSMEGSGEYFLSTPYFPIGLREIILGSRYAGLTISNVAKSLRRVSVTSYSILQALSRARCSKPMITVFCKFI